MPCNSRISQSPGRTVTLLIVAQFCSDVAQCDPDTSRLWVLTQMLARLRLLERETTTGPGKKSKFGNTILCCMRCRVRCWCWKPCQSDILENAYLFVTHRVIY
ncbi:hypothetical protein EV421DRAFT_1821606 [Armillaria borealis]|uniref:Uncharacterized protein n=1 Tax=Armillaria borealis TaxID=47425 RepID=A0AA39MMB1_9AGAR|nr:hypothetical protein EV421DRAFT_1821606 [Armillaria borealis]